MNEDKTYWLTIGRIEPALPKSLAEYEKFQGRGMPIADEIAALTSVLERSHDLKLLSLIARLRILGQNLDGFIDAIEAINYLVQNRWEQVHPQGDVDYRLSLIEALEFMPDTGYPLRDAPLFASPRLGKVSFRLHLLATGALSAHRLSDDDDTAGDDEEPPAPHDIASAAKAAKLDDIVAARDKILSLLSMIEGLEANFEENAGSPLRLKALKELTSKILDFLTYCLSEKDPSLAAPAGPAPGLSMQEAAAQIVTAPAPGLVDSVAGVNAYLRGVEEYYARYEPSSPVRLYVAQCRALVGKSFGEAIELLLPELVTEANLPIGGDLRARLPIAHFSPLLAPAATSPEVDAASWTPHGQEDAGGETGDADDAGERDASDDPYNGSGGGQQREHLVLTRQAAIQSIEAVIGFYRQKEPSSPIPLLLGQARTFATEDFIGALRSVLPKGSFAVDD